MTAEELLIPRFEVMVDYPSNQRVVGAILELPDFDNDFTKHLWVKEKERYPHIFRRLNWWEGRTEEQMPKKVMSMADDKREVFEIQGWDMEIMVGWIDEKRRECCSLLSWNPEYGYFPVN